jgi:hypothetical protein
LGFQPSAPDQLLGVSASPGKASVQAYFQLQLPERFWDSAFSVGSTYAPKLVEKLSHPEISNFRM